MSQVNLCGGFMFPEETPIRISTVGVCDPKFNPEYKGPEDNLFKNQALRYNVGKVELSYLLDAPLAMEGLANRFALGAKKYSRDNWKKGLPTEQIIDALLRHLKAYHNGEEKDEDGGYHVDAITWNAVVLSEQFHRSTPIA